MTNTLSQVQAVLSAQLSVTADQIGTDYHLVDDLGADSLDVVEITMMLEDHFDCVISDEDMQSLSTVADIVQWLEQQQGATHG